MPLVDTGLRIERYYMKKTFTSLLVCFLLTAQAEDTKFYDSYPGTLTVENEKLILNRCTSGNHKYVLVDFDGNKKVERIKSLMSTFKMPVSVDVRGDYYAIGDTNYLKVNKFAFISEKSSCHLEDFLNSVLEQYKTEHGITDPNFGKE